MKNNNFSKEVAIAAGQKMKERDYWLNQLADLVKSSFPRTGGKVHPGQSLFQVKEFSVAGDITHKLMELSNGSDFRLHIILVAGLMLLMDKYTGNEDIVIGAPIYKQDIEGELVNMVLPLRNRVDKNKTFKEFLLEVARIVFEANENQNYPMETLLYKLNLPTSAGDFPLFDAALLLENIHDKDYLCRIKLNTVFRFKKTDEYIEGQLDYNTALYDESFIQGIINHFINLLRQCTGDINLKLSSLEILSLPEKKRLIHDFNNNNTDYPRDKTVCQLIEDQAEKTPARISVVFEENHLAYRELNENANRLAGILIRSGVVEDYTVGILMERTPLLMESILAVWKAGGAYIPMETDYPVQRILQIMNDSGTIILISLSQYIDADLKKAYDGKILLPGEEIPWPSANDNCDDNSTKNPLWKIKMSNLAYVIYTSGSTGKPKGAMVEHAGMMNHMQAKIAGLRLTAKSTVAQNASHTFDISVWQFFAALNTGGRTIIYSHELMLEPEQFITRLIRDQVTTLELVPSYLAVMLDSPAITGAVTAPLFLHYILVTGEETTPHLVKKWFHYFPGIPMVNAYGPTEASDDITHFIMDKPLEMERVPIGKPLQNLNIYIVDTDMNLCPVGVKGEILVSGIGVGRGYLKDSERTARSFMEDPFGEEKGVRLYKTGDLGRWLPDGTIEFFGRKDNQVKIRGYRIEPGEIESRLLDFEGIKEAVIVDRIDKTGNKYLCAYIVSVGKLKIAAVKAHLLECLPDYMMPSYFVELEKIPLTPNGKIDRKALPYPDTANDLGIPYITIKMLEEFKQENSRTDEKIFHNTAVQTEKENLAILEYSKQTGKNYYPLSHPQKMIYYTEKKYWGTSCQNLIYTVKYSGILSRELLEKAINQFLLKNEGPRMRIVEIDKDSSIIAAQYTADYHEYIPDYFDFSGEMGETSLFQWIDETNKKPIPLIDNDLFYFAYIKFSRQESGYYMKFHHIISDGWTAVLAVKEIDRDYHTLEARAPLDDHPNTPYTRFILDEQEYLKSSRVKEDIEFWHKKLLPLPGEINLSSKRGASLSILGGFYMPPIPGELQKKMHEYCHHHKTSIYKIILAALSIYISKVTSRDDFVIGTLNHGRITEVDKMTAGLFIRFIPLRITINKDMNFRDFVDLLGSDINYVLKNHPGYPFDFLINELRQKTGIDPTFFYNVNLIGHPVVDEENFKIKHHFSGYEATPLSIYVRLFNKDADGMPGLELEWNYQVEQFSPEDIKRLYQGLIHILTVMLDDPEKKPGELELLGGFIPPAESDSDTGIHREAREVEKYLKEYGDVSDAIVLEKKDKSGKRYLSAFMVSGNELSVAGLKHYLHGQLPHPLFPLVFARLEKMPLTSNGKVNKKLLELVEIKTNKIEEFMAPQDEVEEKLAGVWAEVLGIPRDSISTTVSFFDLGGHSLKAINMIAKTHKVLEIKLPLAEVFKTPRIKELAEYIASLAKDKYTAIRPVEKRDYYELSSAQKRLYILQQMTPESTAYNMPMVIPPWEEADLEKMTGAFKKLINRHESLRTSFHMVADEPVQRVHDRVEFTIGHCDSINPQSSVPEKDNHDYASQLLQFTKPFDLSHAPLLRVSTVKTGGGRYLLLVDMHHIISDAASHDVLVKDFMALYRGETLLPLTLHYKDYSRWQNSQKQKEVIQKQELYWLNEFKRHNELPVLQLPTDYPRPLIQSFEGSSVTFSVNEQETQILKQLQGETGTTLYMVILSVWSLLLSKLSGQEDIIVGTPVAGRRHSDLEHIIGMFVNTLPIRTFPVGEKTFKEFLKEVKECTLDAFENQDYPFEDLVDKISSHRDTGRNPIFDVMYNLIADDDSQGKIPQVGESDPIEGEHVPGTSKFDIILTSNDQGKRIFNYIRYSTKLFKSITIERIIIYFKNILLSLSRNAEIEIANVEIISWEEKQRLLNEFNDTETAYPQEQTIYELFAEQAGKTPDYIAVIGPEPKLQGAERTMAIFSSSLPGSMSITYKELNRKSNQLAHLLRENGVEPDTIVGIMAERSVEMVVGIMGILKSGGAYMPIDPGYPQERVNYMLADSDAKLLVTTNDKEGEKVRNWESEKNLEIIFLDSLSSCLTSYFPNFLTSHPFSLAYLIYTSGSTGKPKGVMIAHNALVNRLNWMQRNYPIGPGDVILQKTTFTFDVSVWELSWWSMCGAALCLLEPGGEKNPELIVETCQKSRVTVMHFVPSMLSVFLEFVETSGVSHKLTCLSQIFASGEALELHQAKRFNMLLHATNRTRLANLYGPTEATIDISYFNCSTGEPLEIIPIGKPIDNTQLYIVDKGFHLQPVGIAGELCTGGVGLARGYLNRPELTFKKFKIINYKLKIINGSGTLRADFHHSSFNIQHSNLYCTGDLARWLPDGNIEFLGRIDNQVKIRGFRIEPGEIEKRLLTYPGIKEAVVTANEDEKGDGDKYLAAYFVSEVKLEIPGLREYLLRNLPDYMVPAYFTALEKIPLAPNGKIDRKALPHPEVSTGVEFIAPRNKIEEKLAVLWANVLNLHDVKAIGIDDNFFQLGGHSLKATTLVSRIHKEWNVKLPLVEVFKRPQIRTLSEYIKNQAKDQHVGIAPAEKRDYYVLSSAQKRLFILYQIDSKNLAYNITSLMSLEGEVDRFKFAGVFQKIINRQESLRTSFLIIDEEPVQRIHDELEFKIEYYNLASYDQDADSEDRKQSLINDFIRPFDFSQAPLLRVGLIKTSENTHLFMADIHHIISDGISMAILIKEFLAFYNGDILPPMKIQYKDYSQWQNQLLKSREMSKQENYWLEQFAEGIPVLNMLTDYKRPVKERFGGEDIYFNIGKEITEQLQEIIRDTQNTLYIILLAIYSILLSKYTAQEDIIVGSGVAGRNHSDLENIIGMFVNMIAMKSQPGENKTFRKFLEEVKERTLNNFENQDYPFDVLVKKLGLPRNWNRNPLFDTQFTFQNIAQEHLEVKGLAFKPYRYPKHSIQFDLSLNGTESGETITMILSYWRDLFKRETVEKMATHFIEILEQCLANIDIKIGDIKLSHALIAGKSNFNKNDSRDFGF